jgi:DNA polymerase
MNKIAEEIEECKRCNLEETCTNKVVGSGNLDSKLVLVGEAPGRKEDELGIPFVGQAGKKLDDLLKQAGLQRDKVFITNILKCRPPDNRRPRKNEIAACKSHLNKQLNILEPKVVAPMGNSATEFIFNRYKLEKGPIGDLHGQVYPVTDEWGKILLVPLYHPAAAIYNRSLIIELEEDLKKVADLILTTCAQGP